MNTLSLDFSVGRCVCLLWLALAVPASAAPPSTPTTSASATPAKSTLLRDDPLLKQKVTLEATDRPLGNVLKELSTRLKVDLTASSQIADQRVTLHLTAQPLYLLMNRLPQLLSHDPGHPRGYYWERLDRPAKARPAFNLWRDLRSVLDEEYDRDYPRREAAVMLRDLRDLCRMTPEERKNYHGDYPYVPLPAEIKEQPFGRHSMPLVKALKPLTDEQLDALMGGEKIALDPSLFTEEVAAAKQQQRDQMKHQQEIAKLTNTPDPYPNGIPEPPSIAPVIWVSPDDENGRVLSRSFQYAVHIDGVSGGTVIDPYDTSKNPDPNRVARSMFAPRPAAAAPSPVVDLTPLLKDKSVTPEQRGSVGFTLQALAKAAHLSLYQEAFLKPNPTFGFRSNGIATLKAPLSDLILEICDEWNYQAQKVGDDYCFWSRTWALDRAADIPDRLISKWQKRYQKQGMVTIEDHTEITNAITWPQMALTLSMVMSKGCCSDLPQYHMFRLLGRLSPTERAAAFSADGLPLADMASWEQQAFVADFQQDLTKVTSDQLDHAVLTFQTEQDRPPVVPQPFELIIMRISADGRDLFGTREVMSLEELSAVPAAPPAKSGSAK